MQHHVYPAGGFPSYCLLASVALSQEQAVWPVSCMWGGACPAGELFVLRVISSASGGQGESLAGEPEV